MNDYEKYTDLSNKIAELEAERILLRPKIIKGLKQELEDAHYAILSDENRMYIRMNGGFINSDLIQKLINIGLNPTIKVENSELRIFI